MSNATADTLLASTRRHFLGRGAGVSLGAAALDALIGQPCLGEPMAPPRQGRAKRVIFLTQSGGPSQLELFDHKPDLVKHAGTELPASVRMGQRLTGMTANQKQIVMPSRCAFRQYGQSGATIGEWLPHMGHVADEICFIKSMTSEHINHAPAMTFLQTGHQLPGRRDPRPNRNQRRGGQTPRSRRGRKTGTQTGKKARRKSRPATAKSRTDRSRRPASASPRGRRYLHVAAHEGPHGRARSRNRPAGVPAERRGRARCTRFRTGCAQIDPVADLAGSGCQDRVRIARVVPALGPRSRSGPGRSLSDRPTASPQSPEI